MVHKWTTVKPVIGKIMRGIRNMDGSYTDDLTEWVAEAILFMKTRYQLELACDTIDINFHHGKLPCALEALEAVEFNGARVPMSGNIGTVHTGYRQGDSEFRTEVRAPQVLPIEQIGPTNSTYKDTTLERVKRLPQHDRVWYRLNYNKIETSLEHGTFKIYYWATPTDESGFPMIPDNEHYKEAIYFYCRMKMIGAGYEDKVFKYQDCEQRWEINCGRAISQISYPSVDEVQKSLQTNVRLIKTNYHWDSFGHNVTPERDYLN